MQSRVFQSLPMRKYATREFLETFECCRWCTKPASSQQSLVKFGLESGGIRLVELGNSLEEVGLPWLKLTNEVAISLAQG